MAENNQKLYFLYFYIFLKSLRADYKAHHLKSLRADFKTQLLLKSLRPDFKVHHLKLARPFQIKTIQILLIFAKSIFFILDTFEIKKHR